MYLCIGVPHEDCGQAIAQALPQRPRDLCGESEERGQHECVAEDRHSISQAHDQLSAVGERPLMQCGDDGRE